MQGEILEIIEKKKKELHNWIFQFEIHDLVINNCDCVREQNINRALEKMRTHKDLICVEIKAKNLNKILKKIQREDMKDRIFTRLTFAYKIK